MYVYRIPPHPQQRPKVTPLLQGFPISADARLTTYSTTLGTTSVARVTHSAFDFSSTQLGQSSVSRPSESKWSLRSSESGNSSVSKTADARWSMGTTQLGMSAVAKVTNAALALRSTLAGLAAITIQVAADARTFFLSFLRGDATVSVPTESFPTFEASDLLISIDLRGYRSIASKWTYMFPIDIENLRSFRIIDLEMTKTGVRIDPVVIGDDFQVTRVYTGLPTGISIDAAWFTVKSSEGLPDVSALIQKVITPVESASGHIVVASTSGGFLEMFFSPSRTETSVASDSIDYIYDVQVRTTTGKIHTLEKGNISFILGVTSASS